ncbi:hypothetical protein ACROYT_G010771 [Oculina patagonica]
MARQENWISSFAEGLGFVVNEENRIYNVSANTTTYIIDPAFSPFFCTKENIHVMNHLQCSRITHPG